MRRSLASRAFSLPTLLTACGGGGSSAPPNSESDTSSRPVPSVSALASSLTSANTLKITATSDATTVAGYCFSTSSNQPSPDDACFQTSASKDFDLTQPLAVQHVWAKDDLGQVSTQALRGPCSETGLKASDAATNSTVCMMTSLGEMVFELAPEAPITTANFLQYVSDGFYAGTVFHRVIETFMVQGGGFDTSNNRKTTSAPITLEAPSTTGLSNTTGTIAMARTSVLDSATSQFFVNTVDNTFLDTSGGGYAVFGRLIAGESTLNAIKTVAVQSNGYELSSPIDPPVIQWAVRLR